MSSECAETLLSPLVRWKKSLCPRNISDLCPLLHMPLSDVSTSWGGTHQVIQPQMASSESYQGLSIPTEGKRHPFGVIFVMLNQVEVISQTPVSLRDRGEAEA